jgi:hypothetical protein
MNNSTFGSNNQSLYSSYGRVTGRDIVNFKATQFFPWWYVRACQYTILRDYYGDTLLVNGGNTGLYVGKFRNILHADSVCYVVWKASRNGSTITNQAISMPSLISNNITTANLSFISTSPIIGSATVAGGSLLVSTVSETPSFFLAQETTGNSIPTANAGTDQIISIPSNPANLVGSGTDIGGTIFSYTWTQISGPPSTIVSPSSTTTAIAGAITTGIYIYQLKVTDNLGAIALDSVMITLLPVGATIFKDIGNLLYEQGGFLKEAYGVKVAKNNKGQILLYYDYNLNIIYDPSVIYTKFSSIK